MLHGATCVLPFMRTSSAKTRLQLPPRARPASRAVAGVGVAVAVAVAVALALAMWVAIFFNKRWVKRAS